MSFICNKLVISSENKKLVDISFKINHSLALVGQSGSGKSLTLKAILNLLPSNLKHEIDIDSKFDLIKGKTISIVPQNPFTALSPLTKIKDQFLLNKKIAEDYLKMVELEPEFIERYPSELSGGQLQRVIIAMALALKPKLLLLDEPTTALDFDTKESIINLIKNLQEKIGFLILFVTHDIESSKIMCKEIAIIKEGIIVENGMIYEVLENPKTKYAKKLIASNFKNRGFRE